MKAAIRISSRGARSRSSACRTSGKLVVAPSRTALHVPRIAFALTVANVARPCSETVTGPRSTGSPSRTNGTNTATNRTSGSTTRTRLQTVRGLTRASAATTISVAAQATYAGHAASGVETATSVMPAKPISFARGSRRWIGLSRSPATPVWLQAAHAGTRRACRATAPRRRSRPRTRRACRRSPRARSRAARSRRPGTRSRARARPPGSARSRPVSRNALSCGDPFEPVGMAGGERRGRRGEADGEREGEDREETHQTAPATTGRTASALDARAGPGAWRGRR